MRLVLPKVVALFLAMPLLTLWCSAVAIVGGMVSAWLQLGIGFEYFLQALPPRIYGTMNTDVLLDIDELTLPPPLTSSQYRTHVQGPIPGATSGRSYGWV